MEPPAGFGTMRQLREVSAPHCALLLVLRRISDVRRQAMTPSDAWVGCAPHLRTSPAQITYWDWHFLGSHRLGMMPC